MTTAADPTARIAYRATEAASLIGVSRRTLDRAIAAGELRVAKIGSAVVITRIELSRFIEAKSPAAVCTAEGER